MVEHIQAGFQIYGLSHKGQTMIGFSRPMLDHKITGDHLKPLVTTQNREFNTDYYIISDTNITHN